MSDRDYATCSTCGLEYAVIVRENADPEHIEGKQYCPICGDRVR